MASNNSAAWGMRVGGTHEEIERKFIIDTSKLPDLTRRRTQEIEQYYLLAEKEREVRIRRVDDKYLITVKQGSGLVRKETETPITEEMFNRLKPQHKGVAVEKTRYELPYENQKIEVDVYKGAFRGLVVGEAEFESAKNAESFQPSEWLSHEVTSDPRFRNKSLALLEALQPKDIRPCYGLVDGINVAKNRIEEIVSKQGVAVVAVAGGSASGKTSAVAKKLGQMFEGSLLISADDFYKGMEFMEAEKRKGNELNFDQPEAVDLELLRKQIEQLKAGKSVDKPIYSFKTGNRSGSERINPSGVIIVEGLFVINDALNDATDLKIFVDVGKHGRLVRRILRDIERSSFSPKETVRYNLKTVEPMYEKHIRPEAAMADFVIVNDYNPLVEAKKSKQEEFQVKFRTSESIKDRLARMGAQIVTITKQGDTYYAPEKRRTFGVEESLRVRNENGHLVLTYKGPDISRTKELRERPKFDIEIDEDIEGFIKSGFAKNSEIEKQRTLYLLDGNLLSVDRVERLENGDVKELGIFVELRFRNQKDAEENLDPLKKRLGLEESEAITTSYDRMPAYNYLIGS